MRIKANSPRGPPSLMFMRSLACATRSVHHARDGANTHSSKMYYSSAEFSKPLTPQLNAVRRGGHCPKPASMEEDLWVWLNRMWDRDPTQRPTIDEFLDGMKDKMRLDRAQHTWDSVTTSRLRSISLISPEPLIGHRERIGTGYSRRLETIVSSSTLATTATTESPSEAIPSIPSSGTTLHEPLPAYTHHVVSTSLPPYDQSSHTTTLPSYSTQDVESNSVPQWPTSQPRIIRDVKRITFSGDDIIIA
jgi:hypothetical protein